MIFALESPPLLQERDGAMKKVAEYKSKVAEVKQNGRKDISALQAKLAKVGLSSLSVNVCELSLSLSHTLFLCVCCVRCRKTLWQRWQRCKTE